MLARARSWLRWLPFNLAYGRGRILMSELRKARVRLLHPGATIEFGPGTYLGPGFGLEIPHSGTFITGERVEFRRGFHAEISGEGRISIGSGTICTYNVLMQCTTSIEIGERCMFGQSTIVVDGQHRFRDITKPMLAQGYDFEPITIGDDAVITSKCSIMTSVGKRAWIAANAVLTRPAPPYCVMGGVPARVLDYFGPPGGEPEGFTPRSVHA
jgi:abequosyltransferase